ncbi:MAG: hypothetical protein ACFFDN_48575, partial [Candidatus Hodarchaeota archaeon]
EIRLEIKDITNERDKLNNLIINQKNIPKNITDLTSKINTLQKKLKNNENKKISIEKKIEVKKAELEQIQNKIEQIHKKLIAFSNQDENLKEKQTTLLTKINLIKEKNEKIILKKNLIVQRILILPENYNKLINRTDILIEKINEFIEAFYLDFIDYINSELEILLAKLNWNFQEVYIDDDLNLIVKNYQGKPQKFNSLSDFERKSISILILLIIKMKFYPDYPIFAIDDHLNSSDPQRFLNFVPFLYENVIKSKIKLFIITSLPNEFKSGFLDSLEKTQYDKLTIFHKN